MATEIDWKALAAPFAPSEILWRVQRKSKDGTSAAFIPYIDARVVQQRLDDVVGAGGWRNEKPEAGPDGGVISAISIRVDNEWVTKWDGAENTNIEAVKGGLSDAFKRSAVLWGIGRYLYGADETWVKINQYGDPVEPEKLVLKFNGKPFYPTAAGQSGGGKSEPKSTGMQSGQSSQGEPPDDDPPATRKVLSPDKLVATLKTKATNVDVAVTKDEHGVIESIPVADAKALAMDMETIMDTKTRQWILTQAFSTITCKDLNPREAAAVMAWLKDKPAARKDAEGVKAFLERQSGEQQAADAAQGG